MKQWLFLSIICGYIILCFGAGKEGGQTVDALLQKICTAAKDKLKIHTLNPENRKKALEAMKVKIKKASEQKGQQSKAHLGLIIQGLSLLAVEENYQKLCNKNVSSAGRRTIFKEMHAAAFSPDLSVSSQHSNILETITNSNNETLDIGPLVYERENIMRQGQTVDELIQKICSVAKDKLKIHTLDPGNRKKVLEAMKAKLKKASEQKGWQSTAHIRLIIQGVAILAVEENYQKLCNKTISSVDRRAFYKEMNAATFNPDLLASSKRSTVFETTENTNSKLQEVRSLVNKMESIMRKGITKNSTEKEQLKSAERLKSQFIAAFKRAYSNSSNMNTYINLVRQGMDLVVARVLNNSQKVQHNEKFSPGRNVIADGTVQSPSNAQTVSQRNLIAQGLPISPPNAQFQSLDKISASSVQKIITTTEYLVGVTKDFGCNDVINMTCTSLKALDKLICEYDGTTLTMQQICDGHIDCPDASDEKNCIQQAIGKIHKATQVMAKVETSQPCFKSLIDNTLLSKQGEILSGLLNKQVAFLKKYPQMNTDLSAGSPAEKITRQHQLQQTLNEIALEVSVIVRTFASTLISALCRDDVKLDQLIGLDTPEPETLADKEFHEMKMQNRRMWLPSLCKCNKQYCENATACDPHCKRFCYQVFNLENFVCPSVIPGQSAVPLDLVCDGKFDCFDETDERNCPASRNVPTSKTELSELFDNAINLVKEKVIREGFRPARVDMVELQSCISNLQRRTLVYKLDIDSLKLTRDRCFKHLKDIYEVMLEEGQLSGVGQEALYDLLMSVNEKLILALKHTHTGNTNTLSADDCHCRDGKCAQVECPASCERICPAKFVLTNYMCDGTNTTVVPIDAICDNKINCPNAEDELDCKREACRMHHIVMIYSTIDDVDTQYHRTPVGDVLGKWKTKVTSKLVVLEKHGGRITPWLFKDTLSELLKDLAIIYSSIENYNHQEADSRLKKFTKLAQLLMEKVKQCTM